MTLIVYPLLNNNDQKIGSDLQVTQVAEKMQQVNTKGLQTQTSKDLNSSQIVGQSEQEVEKEQQKKESQSGNDEEDQSSTLINDDKESTSINRPEEKQKRTPKENRRSKRPSHPSKSERKAINIVAAKASECFAHRGGKGAITVSFDKNGISHINSFNQGTLSGTESKCILQLFNSIKIEKKSVTGIPIRRSILLSEKHGTGV